MWLTCAPARDSVVNTRSKALITVPSMPSSTTLLGTARRNPSRLQDTGKTGASPANTASMIAQHDTLGARGPTESRLGASGSTPVIGTRRAVGL